MMQNTSQEYKNLIRYSPVRNRSYIKAYIGIINSEAQKKITGNDDRNNYAFFVNPSRIFDGFPTDYLYATSENDFSKVDGSMRFSPKQSWMVQYNNGLVTQEILGIIYLNFRGATGFDIKGLTIDFGECYPVDFSVENDAGTHYYTENNKSYFTTNDIFYGTSYFKITPTKMVNGYGRLRIYRFECGITNVFTNKEVISCSITDYVSPISDTIPNKDISLTVDNQNLYYSVDNPENILAYMETGQEVKISFGYDLTGNGDIEWIKEIKTYLKTWSANDVQAKFTATDRFESLNDTFYRGRTSKYGTILYDLAKQILIDAGFYSEDEYFIDPYLRNIVTYNPIPPIKHKEALQLIANASRCVLYEDREGKICIKSSFIPDMSVVCNGETEYSNVQNVLKNNKKDAYAICSNNFSVVDGSLLFKPRIQNYSKTGYISSAISDAEGNYIENPKITINLEAGYSAFGLNIIFRNIAPKQFKILTYYEYVLVEEKTIDNSETNYITHNQFKRFDKMDIIFTKSISFSRIVIDNIKIGDVTDYRIKYNYLNGETPSGVRMDKIKAIRIERTIFKEGTEKKDLLQEEIVVNPDNNFYTVYFTKPSRSRTILVEENPNITGRIIDESDYFVEIEFSGVINETLLKFKIKGYEYTYDYQYYTVNHGNSGIIKEWKNPLISTTEQAKDLEEWLASYFVDDVEYSINYRGDPSIDANDLFYLEQKSNSESAIRAYQNNLNYNKGWNATMKAKKVIL